MSKSVSFEKVEEPGNKVQASIKTFFSNKSDSELETSPTKTITKTSSDINHFRNEIKPTAVEVDNNVDTDNSPEYITSISACKTKIRKRALSSTGSKLNEYINSNKKKIDATSDILCQSITVLPQLKKQKQNTKFPCKTPQESAINVPLQLNICTCELSDVEKPSGVTKSVKLNAQNIHLQTELGQKIIRTPENNTTLDPTKFAKSPCLPTPIDRFSTVIKRNQDVENSIFNFDAVNEENKKKTSPKAREYNSPLHKNQKIPLQFPNKFVDTSNISRNNDKSPQKSSLTEVVLRRSPRNHELSQSPVVRDKNNIPIKIKSSKQSPIFNQVEAHADALEDFSNMFEDDWDNDFIAQHVEGITLQNLNLQIWQRCEIVDVKRDLKTFNITLKVREIREKSWAICRLEGIWRDSTLSVGDIVCILCVKDDHDFSVINNAGGLLVQWPDTLLSGTTVAGSVFCKRKAVLQERFKGIDCNNKIMTIGSLVHELLEIALRKRLTTISEVTSASRNLLQDLNCLYMLYGSEMSNKEATIEIAKFVPQIVAFIDKYIDGGNKYSSCKYIENEKKSDEWHGEIQSILDIEENIWSPRLGLKGKIDVTVQVLVNSQKSKMLPLELKTGKASLSAEHRGQVLLYSMMLSLKEQARDTSTQDVTQGLLLYLKDMVIVKEISSGHPEKRDLVMLRNQLAYYLARKPKINSTGEALKLYAANTSTSEAANTGLPPGENYKTNQDLVPMELPEPIHHHSACGNCPYLTLCSLYLERYSAGSISENHPISKIKLQALGHLEQTHIEYFIHWTGLLVVEDMEKTSHTPLRDIWLKEPEEREKRGKCLSHMVVSGEVAECDKRYIHTFKKSLNDLGNIEDIRQSSLQAGEYMVVSTDTDIAVATGTISSIDKSDIRISLDRNLLKRNKTDMQYHLDLYESQSMMSFNMTNLGVLMEDLDYCKKLRKMIIDKDQPLFTEKIPRIAATLGKQILSRLNPVQQRAVLKALTADHYLLIKGMPGTGKTQTVAALIELLVVMDKSVLVTSHTHSAVDNVLLRLPNTMKVMRLGSSKRVQPELLMVTEECLTAKCTTPDELTEVYNSVNVVGVTCLGARHPMLNKRKFDVCLVDESTQVLQSAVLRPLYAAKKFVLIGDPDQLPPVVKSNTARRLGLDESLFARLDGLGGSIGLTLQYRMNAVITRLANRLTYSGQLQCANKTVEQSCLQMSNYMKVKADYKEKNIWILNCLSPSIENSVILVDTGNTFEMCQTNIEKQKCQPLNQNVGESRHYKWRSCTNVMETAIVLAIIEALLNAGIESQNIGVMAPYRDQVEQLQKCVSNLTFVRKAPNVEVNTVDQYQGRDKKVIIYSFTKTWNHQKGKFIVKDLEILDDQRRLTVAITRAKEKLIMIGDVATLQHYSSFSKLLECLRHEEKDAFVTLQENNYSLYSLFEKFKGYFNN